MPSPWMSPTGGSYASSYGWSGTNNVPVYTNRAPTGPAARSVTAENWRGQSPTGNVNLFSQDFVGNLGSNVPKLNNPYQPAAQSQPAANGLQYGRGRKAGMVPNYGGGSSGQQSSGNPLADLLKMFGGGGQMPAAPQFPVMQAPQFQQLSMPQASNYGVDTSLDFNLGQPLYPQIPFGVGQGGGGSGSQAPVNYHANTGIQTGQVNPGYMQQAGQNLQSLHNSVVANIPRLMPGGAMGNGLSSMLGNLMQSQYGPSMSAIGAMVHPGNAQHALASGNAAAQAGGQGADMAARRYAANLQNQNRSQSNLVSWLQALLGGSL